MSTRFDAAGDYLYRAASAPTGTSTGYTWMGWVYLSVDRNATGGIAFLYNSVPNAWIGLYVDASGTDLRRDISGNTGAVESLSTGTWYHLCVTYQGSTCKVYINGSLDTTASTSSSVAGATLVMGDNGAGAWINGRLAGVKIWNAVLSDAEVAAEYPYYDDIKGGAWAVYPMEQSGSRTNDVSGNGRPSDRKRGTLTSEADPPGVAWYVTGVNATASIWDIALVWQCKRNRSGASECNRCAGAYGHGNGYGSRSCNNRHRHGCIALVWQCYGYRCHTGGECNDYGYIVAGRQCNGKGAIGNCQQAPRRRR
jgi:hypothetical protein